MPGEAPRTDRALGLAKTVGKFALGWGAFLALSRNPHWLNRVNQVVQQGTSRVLAGLYVDFTAILLFTFAVTLIAGTGLAVLGGLTRMIARARARSGQGDFLDRVRAWTTARPGATRALVAAPALLWVLPLAGAMGNIDSLPGVYARSAFPLLLAAWGVFAMAKKGLRELLAPTMDGAGAQSSLPIGADEIAFDAVAVTRETLVMVGVFTAIVLGVPAFAFYDLFHSVLTAVSPDTGLPSILSFVAYVAFATTGAVLFRKASRIAVGVDGVHVRGTSRARFFAYRDLDGAQANGSSLELVRRGKVVQRLQVHGEDAARREAILARVTENIARAREGRAVAAAQMVASSSEDDLARVAHGAGDYRMASVTREQLWALVEGPQIEASARRAAAEALGRSSDDAERVRLRVAAEHCAEPQVRLALLEIAGEDDARERVQRQGLSANRGLSGRPLRSASLRRRTTSSRRRDTSPAGGRGSSARRGTSPRRRGAVSRRQGVSPPRRDVWSSR